MPIKFVKGDIFESGADILVCPVNCVGVMGAGLAKEFKRRYPIMFESYRSACILGKVKIGHLWPWPGASVEGMGDNILLFPTKIDWRDSSDISWIGEGLCALRRTLGQQMDPESIATPALGCGLGGLPWQQVKMLMQGLLSDLPNKIFVYEPQYHWRVIHNADEHTDPAIKRYVNHLRQTMMEQ